MNGVRCDRAEQKWSYNNNNNNHKKEEMSRYGISLSTQSNDRIEPSRLDGDAVTIIFHQKWLSPYMLPVCTWQMNDNSELWLLLFFLSQPFSKNQIIPLKLQINVCRHNFQSDCFVIFCRDFFSVLLLLPAQEFYINNRFRCLPFFLLTTE